MTVRTIACVLAVTTALFAVACSEDAELQLRTRTSTSSSEYPLVRVSWETPFREAQVDLDAAHQKAGPFPTARSGELHLNFSLVNNGQPSVTSGTLDLPLKSDWRWYVSFEFGDSDPMNGCFGCYGTLPFNLDPALGFDPAMKLWVVWSGNSISNPVIY